jgi:plasmid stabilization system protein ParE
VRHVLRITRRAEIDIDAAVGWIGRQNPSTALRWHTMAYAAILSLSISPERCPLAEEAHDLGLDIRELLIGRRRGVYRVLFTVGDKTVTIHRVRHAAQDRLTRGDV